MCKLSFVALAAIACLSCSKEEDSTDQPPEPTTTICQVKSQSGFDQFPSDTLAQLTFTGNFSKTIAADGKVQQLKMVRFKYFGDVDSLEYNFNYSSGSATFTGTGRWYERNETGSLQLRSQSSISGSVSFNDEGYVTRMGDATFEYTDGKLSGGKLVDEGLDVIIFSYQYDSHGNLTRVTGSIQGIGHREIIYEYDHSRTAKNQMYLGAGQWFVIDFDMLEVMNWIPVQPVSLRTSHTLNRFRIEQNIDSVYARYTLSDHVINSDGDLGSFRMSNGADIDQVVSNQIECTTD